MLRLYVLASGSKGNTSIIADTDTGFGILIDCGISKREFMNRCDAVSFDPLKITDILVTHEHTDHTKGLGVLVRGLAKAGCFPTLRTSVPIMRASADIDDALKTEGITFDTLKTDEPSEICGISVLPFNTSHDATESFGFRFEKRCERTDTPSRYTFTDSIGFMTDTGTVPDKAEEALQYCRILAIESNHDPEMLQRGPYPYNIKRRIASDRGHLSNSQTAHTLEGMLSTLGGFTTEHVVAMHISQENNTYDLPKFSMGKVLEDAAACAELHIATQMHTIVVG